MLQLSGIKFLITAELFWSSEGGRANHHFHYVVDIFMWCNMKIYKSGFGICFPNRLHSSSKEHAEEKAMKIIVSVDLGVGQNLRLLAV